MLSQFALFITTYGFLPNYATRIGATKNELGTLMFIIHLSRTLFLLLTGTVIVPRIGYKATLGIAFGVLSWTAMITPHIDNLRLLILVQGIGEVGQGLSFPVLMGMAIKDTLPEEKATAMGLYQAFYAIGMFLGPIAGGYIGEKLDLSNVFYCGGIMYAITAAISLLLLPRKGTVFS
jgi:MFS family permease